ncbi:hypothetical protein Tco_0454526 [Tanacetum coccineum]
MLSVEYSLIRYHQVIEGLTEAQLQQATSDSQTYSSQRHRQESRRLLEDIIVNWDIYELCSLIFKLELVPSCLINCDLEPLLLDL